jgi:hypothetical protein
MAAELAMHCERGYPRDVQYRWYASDHAMQRSNHEAMIHLIKGRAPLTMRPGYSRVPAVRAAHTSGPVCHDGCGAAVALALDTLTRSA